MSKFQCPECRKFLSVSDVNMEKLVARCTGCNTMFDASPQSGAASSPSLKATPLKTKAVQPKSIQLEKRGSQFSLKRKWFGFHAFFLTFFCIAWDGFLVFWYYQAFSDPNSPLIMKLFPIGHLAAGVGITYYTLALYLNTTSISVSGRRLEVTHAPLPWKGNLTLDKADLKQFFIVEKRGNKGSRYYELCVLLADQTKVTVLAGANGFDELQFIEQTLEEHLGIIDEAVEGEHQG